MDLKIPKALSNRVFNNDYSKHFRDMTSGTKLKKMIKEQRLPPVIGTFFG